ncbi:hypothetical protein D3C81_1222600 [compost metagenome]
MGAGLLHQHLAAGQAAALAVVQPRLLEALQRQRNTEQTLPDHQRALALDFGHAREVVGHQGKGAVGQALAVLTAAHFVEQVQAQHAQYRHHHQRGEHAAVNA